ncbi:hypothetical protein TVAG_214720 [Trichomonas vaginalis G3]|uniref:Initiator binding domain-containing protein n=1 Tax=Trichomonas vaginalis (strain ATCC PRA-98 / G3) TaxID=412133 RepID=A2DK76_TRIV3|nr:transcription-initiator DNA-binding domain ibd family [Trichomonas vaginalis G3]EAY19247.1 hypothetical protein TVAG_214720 [Trichomonas vaginalis G3]KAI5548540.1 transcription-initiator DNA-binding domain ibd family [Trichomonas vaginalis G3]|eukprot:XP_001580233.1 hypothetical protein [Trichomonas vaginalis G3]
MSFEFDDDQNDDNQGDYQWFNLNSPQQEMAPMDDFAAPQMGGSGFVFDFEPDPQMETTIPMQPVSPQQLDWKTTDTLNFMNLPPLPTVAKHRRNLTQPIARNEAAPPKKGESTFIVRRHRKTPSNAPEVLPPEPGSEDALFEEKCKDKNFVINPAKIGFIPSKFWPDKNFAFGDIVADFFQRKNNANCRFSHKLYNAIQISKNLPDLQIFTGVEWVGKYVLKVNKNRFARLLGIHSIDGSLFHQQGNFSTHGFIEVGGEEAKRLIGEAEFNAMNVEVVRLLMHQNGIFNRDTTEEELENCKWVNYRKKGASAQ